jgi:hypothetical protein
MINIIVTFVIEPFYKTDFKTESNQTNLT